VTDYLALFSYVIYLAQYHYFEVNRCKVYVSIIFCIILDDHDKIALITLVTSITMTLILAAICDGAVRM